MNFCYKFIIYEKRDGSVELAESCDTRLDEIGSYKLYTIAETSIIIIVIVNTRMKSYEKYCYFYRQ